MPVPANYFAEQIRIIHETVNMNNIQGRTRWSQPIMVRVIYNKHMCKPTQSSHKHCEGKLQMSNKF